MPGSGSASSSSVRNPVSGVRSSCRRRRRAALVLHGPVQLSSVPLMVRPSSVISFPVSGTGHVRRLRSKAVTGHLGADPPHRRQGPADYPPGAPADQPQEHEEEGGQPDLQDVAAEQRGQEARRVDHDVAVGGFPVPESHGEKT